MRNKAKKILFIIICLILGSYTIFCQKTVKDQYPTVHFSEWEAMNQTKQEAMVRFQEARFGMFIHWGLYSIPGGIWDGVRIHDMRPPHVAEWIMYAAKIPRQKYALLAEQFNPIHFDADKIVSLAKKAGMKYIVVTSKHHDGFALFDSEVSQYNVIDATPFKRDIIKELSEACEKQDMTFGVYYSHNIDWYDGSDAQSALSAELNPNISNHEKTFGANTWDPSPNSFEDYLKKKSILQVKELVNKYPNIKIIWFDMPWRMNAEQSFSFYKTVYDLKPQIIINERIGNGYGDYTIIGDNTIPTEYKHLQKPWETVGTFNNSWGYNSYDNDWKSPLEVLYWLVEIVSKGGNYMLNIGPTSEGIVPAQSIDCLNAVGEWMSVNSEAVYGTKRWEINREGSTSLNFKGTTDRAKKGFSNVFTAKDFWFTAKGDTVYAISFNDDERDIQITSLNKRKHSVSEVRLLGSGKKIKWEQTDIGLSIKLPENLPASFGFVLAISLK